MPASAKRLRDTYHRFGGCRATQSRAAAPTGGRPRHADAASVVLPPRHHVFSLAKRGSSQGSELRCRMACMSVAHCERCSHPLLRSTRCCSPHRRRCEGAASIPDNCSRLPCAACASPLSTLQQPAQRVGNIVALAAGRCGGPSYKDRGPGGQLVRGCAEACDARDKKRFRRGKGRGDMPVQEVQEEPEQDTRAVERAATGVLGENEAGRCMHHRQRRHGRAVPSLDDAPDMRCHAAQAARARAAHGA